MWDKQTVQALLAQSDVAVNRAVLALYARQTTDEQSSASTRESNGAGFNAYDAGVMTRYADWINRRGALSGAHIDTARKILRKYAGQLADISNASGKPVPAKLQVLEPAPAPQRARTKPQPADQSAQYAGTW